MKKIIVFLLLIGCGGMAKAQFPTTDSLRRFINKWIRNSAVEAFQNLRLNTALVGLTNFVDSANIGVDSIWRVPGKDSIFFSLHGGTYKIKDSTGGGSGTVNLDTTRTSTTITIIASGTDAVIPLVDIGSNKAGAMSPTDKGRLDSLYGGLLNDSIEVVQVGRSTGKTITYAKNDTLWSKRVIDSTYISWHTLNDSTIVAVLDTSGLHTAFGSGGGGTPGGSNTQLQYNNSGAFGGTAGITYDATNTGITILKTGLGTTQNNLSGLRLANTTAAAAGAQQISPPIIWPAQGWKTNATAASQEVTWRMDVVPVQGSANPSSYLRVQQNINGGSYLQSAEFYADGMRIGGNNGGGINLTGNPGSVPSPGVITSSIGLAFGTASTVNPNAYDFATTAGWGTVASGSCSLLKLSSGSAGWNQSSGVATFAEFDMNPRITQSGTASGITRGIKLDNTLLTGVVDFRAIEIIGHNADYGFRCDSALVKHYFAGETNIGNRTDQGAFTLQNTGGLYQNGSVSLNATPTASGTYTVLTKQADSTVSQVSVASLLAGGNFTSANYTATLTNGTNVAASSFIKAHYYRQGSHVIVYMEITIDPTATGATDIDISLPIASDIAGSGDVMGVGNCTGIAAQSGVVGANIVNDRATFGFVATDTNSQAFYITFSYEIL